jgi:hypothetical protein
LNVLPALRLRNWRFDAGLFAFDLYGEPGAEVFIQVSSNLTDWTPIATNTLGAAPMHFTDPQSAQFPQRFYRLVKP